MTTLRKLMGIVGLLSVMALGVWAADAIAGTKTVSGIETRFSTTGESAETEYSTQPSGMLFLVR